MWAGADCSQVEDQNTQIYKPKYYLWNLCEIKVTSSLNEEDHNCVPVPNSPSVKVKPKFLGSNWFKEVEGHPNFAHWPLNFSFFFFVLVLLFSKIITSNLEAQILSSGHINLGKLLWNHQTAVSDKEMTFSAKGRCLPTQRYFCMRKEYLKVAFLGYELFRDKQQ